MITDIKVYQEIPDDELECFSIELYFRLRNTIKCFHSPEIHLTSYIENEDGEDDYILRQKLFKFLEENKIGYEVLYIDPVTCDYHHILIVSLYPREKIINMLSSLDNISCGKIYECRLEGKYNDQKALISAKQKLKDLLFKI